MNHKTKDMLERIEDSSPNESSHELFCRLRDCAHEIETLRAALASRSDARADGWLRDGSLLYRLTDDSRSQNRDEINVTMADGSRLSEDRERRAKQILSALIGVSDAQADERGAIYQTRWASPDTVWGDVDKATYDAFKSFGYAARRIVYAAAPAPVSAPSPDREQEGEAGNACLVQEKCAWPDCRRECVIRQDASPSRECGERQDFAAIQALLREVDPKWSTRAEFGIKPLEQVLSAIRDLAASAPTLSADPCPFCPPGQVCKTPKCGRLPQPQAAEPKELYEQRKPSIGWKTWGENNDRCDHCCNGDRCDDPSHIPRRNCPYCLGTGDALWMLPQYASAKGECSAGAQEPVGIVHRPAPNGDDFSVEWLRVPNAGAKLYTHPQPMTQTDAARDVATNELRNIVKAKRFDRKVFECDVEFADWAQNRARYALAEIERLDRAKGE